MCDINEIADKADVIVNGYAFENSRNCIKLE